jgi:Zn-dependent M16 (insulinase) family peptidase
MLYLYLCVLFMMPQYHQDFYRAENLTIIVTGSVEPSQIFQALAPIEAKVLEKRKHFTASAVVAAAPRPFVRPWSTPIPPTPSASLGAKVHLDFPSEDESTGGVLLGWRGCAWEHFDEAAAVSILSNYLCRSPISPLQVAFVETQDDPLCNDVSFVMLAQVEYMYGFQFDNVAYERLDEVHARFEATLQRVLTVGLSLSLSLSTLSTLSTLSPLNPHPPRSTP